MNESTLIPAIAGLAMIVGAMGREILNWARGPKSSNGSGEKPVAFWDEEIRRICYEAVHAALLSRNEELRRLMREELDRMCKYRDEYRSNQ